MLAISQSGTTFHYMNWIPSESGPLVTHYGSIDKDLENPDKIDDHYLDVFERKKWRAFRAKVSRWCVDAYQRI